MHKVRDWDAVEAYFDYGLDVHNRRVFLLGDVEEEGIANATKGIYYLAGQSEKEPIELFIGSFGGSEYEMLGLYDVLNSIACPIHTIAMGKCMSAAPLLVAAGTPGQRWSMPNAQWMVHMSWGEIDENARIDHAAVTVAHYEELTKTWYELMARHTKLSVGQWTKHCKQVGDKYFSAEQALKWGLVDQLWDQREGV